jgi:predicted CoA-substrate-specific enzyme activase
MFTAGVDIGSRTSKAVVIDRCYRVLGEALLDTAVVPGRSGLQALEQALAKARLDSSALTNIVATGYGRVQADFAQKTLTEISCHARGVHAIENKIRTVIDIGGQDSKVIKIDGSGRVLDFAMNDRCAAGTGKFLEVMARALDTDLDEFAGLYFTARKPCCISSVCTVFAESEVISLMAEGSSRENIIAGLHQAVAKRVANMVLRLGLEEKVGFTGGVAKNQGMMRALEQELGIKFRRLKYNPQLVGALGAAILACENGK